MVIYIHNLIHVGGVNWRIFVPGQPEPRKWDSILQITKTKKVLEAWIKRYNTCLASPKWWAQIPCSKFCMRKYENICTNDLQTLQL
jgi:hypothetical protein